MRLQPAGVGAEGLQCAFNVPSVAEVYPPFSPFPSPNRRVSADVLILKTKRKGYSSGVVGRERERKRERERERERERRQPS
jgi:hypothetical protein